MCPAIAPQPVQHRVQHDKIASVGIVLNGYILEQSYPCGMQRRLETTA